MDLNQSCDLKETLKNEAMQYLNSERAKEGWAVVESLAVKLKETPKGQALSQER